MVKRGHEVDMEYSKKRILDKMNSYFGYSVVEKLKLIIVRQIVNIWIKLLILRMTKLKNH